MGHRFLKLTVSGNVRKICTTADQIILVSGEGFVHVLDLDCQLLRTLEIGQITAACDAVLTFGDTFMIGDKGGNISIWNLTDGTRQHNWCHHEVPVTALVFIDDSKTLLACSYTDGMIQVIDCRTGCVQRTFLGHGPSMVELFYSSTLNSLVSASWEAGIRIWDLNTGECTSVIDSPAQHVQWAGDDRRLATGSHESLTVQIWNVSDGSLLMRLAPPHTARATLTIEPYSAADFNGMMTTHKDGSICIWDCDRGIQLYAFQTGKTSSGCLRAVRASTYNGEQAVHRIVTGHRKGIVRLWRIPALDANQDHQENPNDFEDLPSPRGEKLVKPKDDEMHCYGVVSPLTVLDTSSGVAVGAAISKSPTEEDPSNRLKLVTDFHLCYFDENSW